MLIIDTLVNLSPINAAEFARQIGKTRQQFSKYRRNDHAPYNVMADIIQVAVNNAPPNSQAALQTERVIKIWWDSQTKKIEGGQLVDKLHLHDFCKYMQEVHKNYVFNMDLEDFVTPQPPLNETPNTPVSPMMALRRTGLSSRKSIELALRFDKQYKEQFNLAIGTAPIDKLPSHNAWYRLQSEYGCDFYPSKKVRTRLMPVLVMEFMKRFREHPETPWALAQTAHPDTWQDEIQAELEVVMQSPDLYYRPRTLITTWAAEKAQQAERLKEELKGDLAPYNRAEVIREVISCQPHSNYSASALLAISDISGVPAHQLFLWVMELSQYTNRLRISESSAVQFADALAHRLGISGLTYLGRYFEPYARHLRKKEEPIRSMDLTPEEPNEADLPVMDFDDEEDETPSGASWASSLIPVEDHDFEGEVY